MKATRLVAIDLDGTLLGDSLPISARNLTALDRIRQAGIHLLLVSARAPRGVVDIARQVGARGPAICCNGAIVLDLESIKVSKQFPLPAPVSARIVSHLRSVVPGVVFAWEAGLNFGREPGYDAIARPLTDDEKEICALDDVVNVVDMSLAKLIVRHPTFDFDELHKLVGEIARNEAEVTVSSRLFVEISAAGVNKASALRVICDNLEIVAEEVVAIGDMPNDLPMLNWAGRGIAMANAHPMVLAEAREVTASNLEDGWLLSSSPFLTCVHLVRVVDVKATFPKSARRNQRQFCYIA